MLQHVEELNTGWDHFFENVGLAKSLSNKWIALSLTKITVINSASL